MNKVSNNTEEKRILPVATNVVAAVAAAFDGQCVHQQASKNAEKKSMSPVPAAVAAPALDEHNIPQYKNYHLLVVAALVSLALVDLPPLPLCRCHRPYLVLMVEM